MNKPVVPVLNLSQLVAFRPKEIQIQKEVYDLLPEQFRKEFEGIMINAEKEYKELASKVVNGTKMSPMSAKTKIVNSLVIPYLQSKGINQTIKKTDTQSRPSTKKAKETLMVISKLTEEQKELVAKTHSNFSSEDLEDSVDVATDAVGEVEVDTDLSDINFEDLFM